MGTQSQQGTSDLSPTAQALRRQLEEERKHPPTPEEEAQIAAAQQEWAQEMSQLDLDYRAMLDADPELRRRLQDGTAVLDALLDAVADDRGDR